ncbi:serine/threonine-protein phosphatase 6 regulatory ankyrin repeat subunit A-like isoform X2 [Phymastichus coffea]|uniref:serine/threonine-protein phosphatase 6 regulatory ankyrin repeat subunit A-like isoform X2 n=1 Tax=Phymastichus coffea TaxID=108790 RepID=UPI00273B7E5F|nr:serine/threonine-protein phosphatase 6 regulatory ankyrin repeat subunit A-like isoform X2 [Phymastichus coffea]
MDRIGEKKKRCRLAQLRTAVSNFSNPRITEKILAAGVDVNSKLQGNSPEPRFTTALHLAAAKGSLANFEILLDHGADVTMKDSDGLTALQRVARDCLTGNADEPPSSPLIRPALSAHVKSKKPVNPDDGHGFTHMHVACATNAADAVAFFLDHGAAVDQAVSADAALFPGYTPLHFAARFAGLAAARLLVGRGADAALRDARGASAAQVLIERKIATLERLEAAEAGPEAALGRIADGEAILELLLGRAADIGMPEYHAACALRSPALAARLLDGVGDVDARIAADAPAWPGYTALHFAAHCSVDAMLLLLARGASVGAREAGGATPLEICARWCGARDLHRVMSAAGAGCDVAFSGGGAGLLECVAAMRSVGRFERFLRRVGGADARLPADSPLWPGSTPLHLAVLLSGRRAPGAAPGARARAFDAGFAKACLDRGVAVDARDARGRAAVHLAFRLGKASLVETLLRHHREDASDDEGLSLLHVACASRSLWPVEQWSRSSRVDVNLAYAGAGALAGGAVRPGWTALHAAVAANASRAVVEVLLRQGASPYLAGSDGLTPVQLLLLADPRVEPSLAELLLSRPDLREAPAGAAFAHLHVASYFDDARTVERLLDLGSDVDAPSRLPRFHGPCSPLHLAIASKSMAVVEVLVRRGADVLARGPDGSTPLSRTLGSGKHSRSLNAFVAALRASEALRGRVEKELGLTMLHAVCHAGHVDAVRDLLDKGADANARLRDDSAFWPGWTPLHVLVTTGIEGVSRQNNFTAMLETLLAHGADASIANAHGDTPLHLTLRRHPCDTGYFVMTSLLAHQRGSSANPANRDGLTHFHAACLANDLEAVSEFLASDTGLDVNAPVDYFAELHAGSTALHLALNSNSKRQFGVDNQLRTLELLLRRGADLRAEDDHGYTPLHVAADCDPSAGADVDARTLDGKTVFEMLLYSKEVSVEEVGLLVRRGCRANGCNPMTDRGHLSIILNEKNSTLRAEILEALMAAPDIAARDEMGRSAVHNVVATNDLVIQEHHYVELIDKLIKLGCDLDEQDNSGMTALHLAVLFRNTAATTALLICGADINVLDRRGKTAFRYALEPCTRCFARCSAAHDCLLSALVDHVHGLRLLGLHVNELNGRMQALALENRWIRSAAKHADYDRSRRVDDIAVGVRGWTLRDFLVERGVVVRYHRLTPAERAAVDRFFESLDYHAFRDLRYMLKIQYRQAVARVRLFEPAIAALEALLLLPSVCAEVVVCQLRNPDLKNVIAAAAAAAAEADD